MNKVLFVLTYQDLTCQNPRTMALMSSHKIMKSRCESFSSTSETDVEHYSASWSVLLVCGNVVSEPTQLDNGQCGDILFRLPILKEAICWYQARCSAQLRNANGSKGNNASFVADLISKTRLLSNELQPLLHKSRRWENVSFWWKNRHGRLCTVISNLYPITSVERYIRKQQQRCF